MNLKRCDICDVFLPSEMDLCPECTHTFYENVKEKLNTKIYTCQSCSIEVSKPDSLCKACVECSYKEAELFDNSIFEECSTARMSFDSLSEISTALGADITEDDKNSLDSIYEDTNRSHITEEDGKELANIHQEVLHALDVLIEHLSCHPCPREIEKDPVYIAKKAILAEFFY